MIGAPLFKIHSKLYIPIKQENPSYKPLKRQQLLNFKTDTQ